MDFGLTACARRKSAIHLASCSERTNTLQEGRIRAGTRKCVCRNTRVAIAARNGYICVREASSALARRCTARLGFACRSRCASAQFAPHKPLRRSALWTPQSTSLDGRLPATPNNSCQPIWPSHSLPCRRTKIADIIQQSLSKLLISLPIRSDARSLFVVSITHRMN